MFKTYYEPCFVLLIILPLMLCTASFSQAIPDLRMEEDSKIWPRKDLDAMKARYMDENGNPSYQTFLKMNGLFSEDLTVSIIPYFTASFDIKEIIQKDGKFLPSPAAKPLNPDFYVTFSKEYRAFQDSNPIRDGRVYEENNSIAIGGYSSKYNERKVAIIDEQGHFIRTMADAYADDFPILNIPAGEILFDPFQLQLLHIQPAQGRTIVDLTTKYLPLDLYTGDGILLGDLPFKLEYEAETSSLTAAVQVKDQWIAIASCSLTNAVIIKTSEGYQPRLNDGCVQPLNGKVYKITFQGEFSDRINLEKNYLQLSNTENSPSESNPLPKRSIPKIDGDFREWRNIKGISDPEGDFVSYLYPNPDTDLLEFKVSHDDKNLYLYSRLAGAHGRTGKTGRYYWYVYIDVDRNPATGYAPTRDDNCYFGVALGDDSEAQFEFVGNEFIKTFFGFTGVGTEKEVLSGNLQLGPSHYAPADPAGNKRDRYKVEYVNRQNGRFITHDYTEGTSEDIIIALSPDGSEVEMRVAYTGFLKDQSGRPLMQKGNTIDIAVGAEAASDYYGSDKWGADSSPVIYNYYLE